MFVKQKTNKLFYGKYPYKITCGVQGAHYIRKHSESVIRHLHQFAKDKIGDDLIEFIFHATHYLTDKNIKKRIERYYIDFYIETESEYLDIQTRLSKYISCVVEPANKLELNLLAGDYKKVLCNFFPKGKYQFKIVFKSCWNVCLL